MDGKECNNSDSSISEYDPNVDRLDNISHTKSYYSEASWLYDDMEYGEDDIFMNAQSSNMSNSRHEIGVSEEAKTYVSRFWWVN